LGASQSGCAEPLARSALPATIVFRTVMDAKLAIPPPRPAPAVPLVVAVIVTLLRSAAPCWSFERPPPLLPLWLPLIVELTAVNTPSL
jgi:hypothetical protein